MTTEVLKKAIELQKNSDNSERECEAFRPLLHARGLTIGDEHNNVYIDLTSEDPDDQELIISTRNALHIIACALNGRAVKKLTAFSEYAEYDGEVE